MEVKRSARKEIARLIVAFLIVLILLGGFTFYHYWPTMTGKKIVLDTRPVDPFDPFRGQYMNIGYEISSVNAEGFEVGDDIYVSLKEDEEGVWRFKGVSDFKPDKGDFIKGEVRYAGRGTVSVEYGIEQFFFERGADVPTVNITVEIKVANSGRAKLSQLLQNGKPVVIEYEKFDITN